MTSIEKANELIAKFGMTMALKVVEELLNRDKQWVEKLSDENPETWQLSDFDKSIKMFDQVKNEINYLTSSESK